MEKEFTYNQIAHLNAALGDQNLPYHVHYKDGHTAGIEGFSTCACSGKEGMMKDSITSFFQKEGMDVTFGKGNYTFSPK